MSKIAIINMDGHGHVNPTLGLTRELVRRGHDVHYAVTDTFATVVGDTGAKVHLYESSWRLQGPPKAEEMAERMASLPVRLLSEAAYVMPQLKGWLEELAPDVVLFDSMVIAGRLLAESLGLPGVQLSASYASNAHFDLMGFFLKDGPAPAVRAEAEKVAADLAERYRIKPPPVGSLFRFAAALNLVFMPRAFQVEGEHFDDRFIFCGPQIAPRRGAWQPPLSVARGERPLLFISLGTVFSNWPEFFNHCFAAFGDLPVEVLMATSDRIDQTLLSRAPANVTVATHVPQLEVLAQADVFLTHGGMNCTMEALYFGVPLAVVPQMPEQAVTARRVAELGLGRAFTREQVTVALLREEVLPLIHDAGVHAAVARLQRLTHEAGGVARAVEALEGFLAGRASGPHGEAARSTETRA